MSFEDEREFIRLYKEHKRNWAVIAGKLGKSVVFVTDFGWTFIN